MSLITTEVMARITGDPSRFLTAMSRVSQKLERLRVEAGFTSKAIGGGFDAAAARAELAAARMNSLIYGMKGLVTAVGLIGGASAVMSADVEASLAKIEGLVGININQMVGWEEEILKIAETYGVLPGKVAGAMFYITSAGLRGKDAMEALTEAVKISAAGLGNLDATARSMVSVMNAYGTETMTAARAADVLVGTIREGNMVVDELAPTLGRIIPTASQIGVEFEDLGAAIATMTRLGMPANQAITALNMVLMTMIKPLEKGRGFLDEMGMSYAQLRNIIQKEGLLMALLKLKPAIEANIESLGSIAPRIRAVLGLLSLVGQSTEMTTQVFERMHNIMGARNIAWQAQLKTTKKQFERTMASIAAAFVRFGDTVRTVVTPALTRVSSQIRDFSQLILKIDPVKLQSTVSALIKLAEVAIGLAILKKVGGYAVSLAIGLQTVLAPALRGVGLIADGVYAIFFRNSLKMMHTAKNMSILKRATLALSGGWKSLTLAMTASVTSIGLFEIALAAAIGGATYKFTSWMRDEFIKSAQDGSTWYGKLAKSVNDFGRSLMEAIGLGHRAGKLEDRTGILAEELKKNRKEYEFYFQALLRMKKKYSLRGKEWSIAFDPEERTNAARLIELYKRAREITLQNVEAYNKKVEIIRRAKNAVEEETNAQENLKKVVDELKDKYDIKTLNDWSNTLVKLTEDRKKLLEAGIDVALVDSKIAKPIEDALKEVQKYTTAIPAPLYDAAAQAAKMRPEIWDTLVGMQRIAEGVKNSASTISTEFSKATLAFTQDVGGKLHSEISTAVSSGFAEGFSAVSNYDGVTIYIKPGSDYGYETGFGGGGSVP